ncbi:815_t:CDS:2, partial [Gigaspora margarita]
HTQSLQPLKKQWILIAPPVDFFIPLEKGVEFHKNRDHKAALKCFEENANLGNPLAKYWLGYYLTYGYKVIKIDREQRKKTIILKRSNEKMNEIREEHKRLFNNTSEYEKLRAKCMKLLDPKNREEICIYEEKNHYLELKKVIEIPNNEEAEIIKNSRIKFEIDYIKNYNNPTKKLTQFPFLKNKLEEMSNYPFYRIICLQSADQTINVSSEYKKFRNKIVNEICGILVTIERSNILKLHKFIFRITNNFCILCFDRKFTIKQICVIVKFDRSATNKLKVYI